MQVWKPTILSGCKKTQFRKTAANSMLIIIIGARKIAVFFFVHRKTCQMRYKSVSQQQL